MPFNATIDFEADFQNQNLSSGVRSCEMNSIIRTKKIPSGTEIKLVEGDITLAKVEGIVNPANAQLRHGGGLAGYLANKAGSALQAESTQWVNENGPVSHDNPAHTSAGDLPFKSVIHAVGPVWGSGNEADKLSAAVKGALNLAEELQLNSLALPAISTGIFGYPLDEAARIILSAVLDTSLEKSESIVEEVQIVVHGSRSAQVFQQVWDAHV